jgi:hypothetical protein
MTACEVHKSSGYKGSCPQCIIASRPAEAAPAKPAPVESKEDE